MGYRIVKTNSAGEIESISQDGYEQVYFANGAPQFFAFGSLSDLVEESIIPTTISSSDVDEVMTPIMSGSSISYRSYSPPLDPRVECILTIDYPSGYVQPGFVVQQDITKADGFAGDESSTFPFHSTTQKKFGTSSARFTKPSNPVLAGGGLKVTNLNKINSPTISDVVGASIDFAVEFFFNATSSAFAEDFTLVQRGTNATGAWKVSFDQSSNVVEFKYRTHTGACGSFPNNFTILSGPTGNTWYHIAVSQIRNGSSQVPVTLAGYLNGVTAFVNTISSGSALPAYAGSMPMYIGNSDAKDESFDGYIDSLRYLISGTTTGVFGTAGYGFVPHGSGSLGVPTLEGFTLNSQTAFLFNFNNVDGSTAFYAQSTDYITSIATRVARQTLGITTAPSSAVELGVREVFRVQRGITGATGLSDGIGFSANYGTIAVPYINPFAPGQTGYYDHGYDHAFGLYNVNDTGLTFSSFRSIYQSRIGKENVFELSSVIEGFSGISGPGSLGSPLAPIFGTNPFKKLFGSSITYGACGNHNSLFIDPKNGTLMRYIFDNGELAASGVSSSYYSFEDAYGYQRKLTPNEIINLRLDLLDYFNVIRNRNETASKEISGKTANNDIKKAYLAKEGTKAALVSDGEILPPTKS